MRRTITASATADSPSSWGFDSRRLRSVGDNGKRDDGRLAVRGRFEEKHMKTTAAKVVGPRDGKAGFLGSIGVRFMIDGAETDGGFSLVEHPMSPRAVAGPLHKHKRGR